MGSPQSTGIEKYRLLQGCLSGTCALLSLSALTFKSPNGVFPLFYNASETLATSLVVSLLSKVCVGTRPGVDATLQTGISYSADAKVDSSCDQGLRPIAIMVQRTTSTSQSPQSLEIRVLARRVVARKDAHGPKLGSVPTPC